MLQFDKYLVFTRFLTRVLRDETKENKEKSKKNKN